MEIDILSLLDELGVDYETEGKNISGGWIGLNCPFCDDPSNHLGINIETGSVSCWRCGKKSIIRLVKNLVGLRVKNVDMILARHRRKRYEQGRNLTAIQGSLEDVQTTFPSSAKKVFPELHLEWLKKRKYNPAEVIKRYDLYAVYQTGKYKYRIVAPIYFRGQLVSFVARDVTEEAEHPYLNCPNEDSVIPVKRCLYNIDSVRKTALVVEGITDVWRIGRGTVATFGIEFTKAQVNMLSGLDKVFVMFDAETQAIKQARKFAAMATSVVKSVEIIEMESGDPDSLRENFVRNLRLEIFGRR